MRVSQNYWYKSNNFLLVKSKPTLKDDLSMYSADKYSRARQQWSIAIVTLAAHLWVVAMGKTTIQQSLKSIHIDWATRKGAFFSSGQKHCRKKGDPLNQCKTPFTEKSQCEISKSETSICDVKCWDVKISGCQSEGRMAVLECTCPMKKNLGK